MRIDFIWSLAPFYPKCNIPFAITVWDIAHRVTPYFPEVSSTGWLWDDREELYRTSLPRAAMVISSTQRGKFELERAYGLFPDVVKVIPFPITRHSENKLTDQLTWHFPFAKNTYLFYPAQFWPHKNHIVVIKALKILRDQGHLICLVFTGSDKGNEQYIRNFVANYGMQNFVHFLGFVSDQEILMLYKNAIALTYASLIGPSNLPPIEAMALNCPVICADSPGMRDQLQNAALFFPATNAEVLGENIIALLRPEVRKVLNDSANSLLVNYTPEAYIKEVIRQLDAFSLVRECWGYTYTHT